ncbi:MAG: hypothetical protein WCC74_01850, partial [Minisyncoccia bacterium]
MKPHKLLAILALTLTVATADEPIAPSRNSRAIQLVIDDTLLAAVKDRLPSEFKATLKSQVTTAWLEAVAAGDSLVWIGEGTAIPKELWIGTFRPAGTNALVVTQAERSPIDLPKVNFRKTSVASGCISPVKLIPRNNIDEQPRAEFLPILEAKDRFGQVIGYPAVLMQHYGPSMARHRFAGSECFFFLFDKPLEALDADGWGQVLENISARFRAHLQIKRVTTDYASYRPGERVRVRAQVTNWRPNAAATELRFYAKAPGEKEYRVITKWRRCPDAYSEAEATADFLPRGPAGLWSLRVEAWQDPQKAEELGLEGKLVLVDRREIGVVLLPEGELKTPPILSLNGAGIE